MPRIGERLAEARRAKGRSLADVGRATKIRGKYLEALEADEYDSIPDDAYARGFLKNYAEYLELDANELLRQHRLEHPKPMVAGIPKPMDELHRDQTHLPAQALVIAGIVIAAALVVWIIIGIIGAIRPTPKPAHAKPKPAASTPAVVRTAPRKNTVIALAPTGQGLAYVEVSVGGRVAWQGLLSQHHVFRGKNVRVRTAHPELLKLSQDGKPVVLGAAPGTPYDQTFLGR